MTGRLPAALMGLDQDTLAVVDRALLRMRLLAAVVLLFQSLMERPAPGEPPVDLLRELLLAGVVLAMLNGLSAVANRQRGSLAGLLLGGLVHTADIAVAVTVVAVSRHSDVGWVLLVVPVLAGALRYRLRGAFLTWGAVVVLHLALLTAAAGDTPDMAVLGTEVTHLAVVLLVALPAGYLSEHLLIEVRGLARVFAAADRRSGLLEVVAESSQRVNDLDSQVLDAAVDAALGVGFAAAELWERDGSTWHRLAARPPHVVLPELRDQLGGSDGTEGPLVVDRATGSPAEVRALTAARLEAAVLTPVPGRRSVTVLRAVLAAGDPLNPSQVECLELLARQAGVALRNGELIADLHQAREELEHQAFHDPLTGLANRALFTRRLEATTAEAGRTGRRMALLFCDLDRFKAVNDGLGHAVGNDLLVAAVDRLRACVREGALLARMGGDEFTLLLPEIADAAEAEHVAARVCKALTEPFALAGHEVVISTSVGIAYGDEQSVLDPGELLRRADVAMYRAKARGRACWTVWGEELEEATLSRLRLERDLRGAVDSDGIDVVLQPVLRADGTVVGAETLARWHHPELGLVSPSEFIPIAEDSDLIVDLGWRITRRAVAVARAWLADTDPECFVAVNVSPRQLASPGFAAELDALVGSAGLPPRRLLLEITERIVTTGPDAVQALHDLAARGYRLGLDDFGQGQTSLQHLRHFPLTVLKIDRGFVADAAGDARVRVILAAIIDLGRALDLSVIAEGIETQEQADALRALGCTYLQGYGLAMPVPAAQLPTPTAPRPELEPARPAQGAPGPARRRARDEPPVLQPGS